MTTQKALEDLFHVEPEVRLRHFERLCRREKTTEVISEDDLKLLQRFIYFNVNVSDQGFRQRFLTCIKYLLIQLKESGYSTFTVLSRKNDCDESELDPQALATILTRYEAFIHWLIDFSFYCFRLRGNYSRRASALHILHFIYCFPILQDNLRSSYVSTWNIGSFWSRENVNMFVSCLADPYESNQALALAILKTISDDCSFLDWPAMLRAAFDWCSTSKTQYPEIAVYCFLLAVSKVDLFPMLVDSSERDVDFVASYSTPNASWSLRNRNCLVLSRRFLTMLRGKIDAAEKDLVRAAVEGPPWGLLKSLLYVLKEVEWSSILSRHEDCSQWKLIIEALLAACHRLTKVVAPIINSISPEGYLPMDMVRVDSDFLGDRHTEDQKAPNEEAAYESDSKFERWHQATCQAVLVCSWRTQKEVSAVFGFAASLQHPQPLLRLEQLILVGEYFLVQLTECKHRGAFECAYAAFVDVCASAWKASSARTSDLPKVWLRRIVDGLVAISGGQGGDGRRNYCVTRRSAGVPFLIQAVLGTEPKRKDGTGSALLYETLEKLLRILFEEKSENAEDKATAKVHSLNILRALVRESKLGLACLTPSWLSLIAQADLLAFTHQSWAVRNSAILLFSAWLVRIFGVPRSRDEVSMKNRMSAADFDALCPDLFGFMLRQLRLYCVRTSQCPTAPFHEMVLFPILTILTRLHQSSASDSVLRLFVPYVLDILLSCPIITVRRSAASALRSVMDNAMIGQILNRFRTILTHDGWQCSQNAMHGMLLLIGCDADGFALSGVNLLDLVARLCPVNSALLLRIVANSTRPLASAAATVEISRMFSTLNASERFGEAAYSQFALFALLQTVENIQGYDQLRACCKINARFRCAFYKQWRSLFKKQQRYRDRLLDFASRFRRSGLIWQDVLDENGDLKLRIQACKLELSLPSLFSDPEESRNRARELLQLYETCPQAVLQRRFFQGACHVFGPTSAEGTDELGEGLLHELDAASRPVRSLDDRLMVVNCLRRLDLGFLKSHFTSVIVILIRLLTDLENVVRDEAATLFSLLFSDPQNAVHSELALFTCVAKLVWTKDGKRAIRGYLSEIVEELDKTLEDNAAHERVFDKNEANYNSEPLLIAEWLRRLLAAEKNTDRLSAFDVMQLVDSCLSMDGLKVEGSSLEPLSECREVASSKILRRVMESLLNNA